MAARVRSGRARRCLARRLTAKLSPHPPGVRSATSKWSSLASTQQWRGYEYDAEGRLTVAHEYEGSRGVDIGSLTPHSISNSDIVDVVDDHRGPDSITSVDWQRETDVGGLLAVRERGGDTRWEHIGSRAPGHLLSSVKLDNATYSIEHDQQGRVTEGADGTFVYGPRGRLVYATGGPRDEVFLYHADGRLAASHNGKASMLVHDGDQLIAAVDLSGTPLFEVVTGNLDQVFEYDFLPSPAHPNAQLLVALTDHRNSTVGWFDRNAGELRDIIEYTPQGRVALYAPDGTPRCREEGTGTDCVLSWGIPLFGFAGAYHSEGVVHMRNRWYPPKLGQ